eukprot:jgi/Chrzof1/8097/UNPLg00142.t1
MALDEGRVNLFMAAHSKTAIEKPTTFKYSGARYYNEMGFKKQQRWEQQRQEQPHIRDAIMALSASGGTKNCRLVCWWRSLMAQRQHWDALKEEFIVHKHRAKWKMLLYRNKRSSLDRVTMEMLNKGVKTRPLVLGIGDATFPATGRGELAAPTAQLANALLRSIRRTNRQIIRLKIDEYRTTMCCCSCGQVTQKPYCWDQRRGRYRESRRLTH